MKNIKPTFIAVLNHKGGVGKTTSALNLGAGLAHLGRKVLLIDSDSQFNMTSSLTDLEIKKDYGDFILGGVKAEEVILKDIKPNLDLIPASESMMDLELNLVNQVSRENRLKKAIKNSPILKTYDFILIDSPPTVGLIVLNSLTASDFYLVPVSTSYLSLNGIKLLMGVIKQVKEDLNPELKNLGYLLTMVDKRKSISSDVEKILRESFEKEVFTNFIRVNTKLESCPFERKTIFEMEKINDKGHLDFLNASKELIERSSWL